VRSLILLIELFCSGVLDAGSLNVTVRNGKGVPVSDAVVFAKGNSESPSRARKDATIDQINSEFVPYVTAVQVGTSILFPNKDNIRHHVYSFSPAKKFELPLYEGTPAAPVVFDKVGFVTLGCNIHDWMIAYVAVLPTPHFQITGNDGRVLLKNLPAGQYTVEVWQPSLKGSPEQTAQHVDLSGEGTKDLAFTLELKPDFRVKRAPSLSNGGYR
jgi:plastocyanin